MRLKRLPKSREKMTSRGLSSLQLRLTCGKRNQKLFNNLILNLGPFSASLVSIFFGAVNIKLGYEYKLPLMGFEPQTSGAVSDR